MQRLHLHLSKIFILGGQRPSNKKHACYECWINKSGIEESFMSLGRIYEKGLILTYEAHFSKSHLKLLSEAAPPSFGIHGLGVWSSLIKEHLELRF